MNCGNQNSKRPRNNYHYQANCNGTFNNYQRNKRNFHQNYPMQNKNYIQRNNNFPNRRYNIRNSFNDQQYSNNFGSNEVNFKNRNLFINNHNIHQNYGNFNNFQSGTNQYKDDFVIDQYYFNQGNNRYSYNHQGFNYFKNNNQQLGDYSYNDNYEPSYSGQHEPCGWNSQPFEQIKNIEEIQLQSSIETHQDGETNQQHEKTSGKFFIYSNKNCNILIKLKSSEFKFIELEFLFDPNEDNSYIVDNALGAYSKSNNVFSSFVAKLNIEDFFIHHPFKILKNQNNFNFPGVVGLDFIQRFYYLFKNLDQFYKVNLNLEEVKHKQKITEKSEPVFDLYSKDDSEIWKYRFSDEKLRKKYLEAYSKAVNLSNLLNKDCDETLKINNLSNILSITPVKDSPKSEIKLKKKGPKKLNKKSDKLRTECDEVFNIFSLFNENVNDLEIIDNSTITNTSSLFETNQNNNSKTNNFNDFSDIFELTSLFQNKMCMQENDTNFNHNIVRNSCSIENNKIIKNKFLIEEEDSKELNNFFDKYTVKNDVEKIIFEVENKNVCLYKNFPADKIEVTNSSDQDSQNLYLFCIFLKFIIDIKMFIENRNKKEYNENLGKIIKELDFSDIGNKDNFISKNSRSILKNKHLNLKKIQKEFNFVGDKSFNANQLPLIPFSYRINKFSDKNSTHSLKFNLKIKRINEVNKQNVIKILKRYNYYQLIRFTYIKCKFLFITSYAGPLKIFFICLNYKITMANNVIPFFISIEWNWKTRKRIC
jgi:hypothetical protein